MLNSVDSAYNFENETHYLSHNSSMHFHSLQYTSFYSQNAVKKLW